MKNMRNTNHSRNILLYMISCAGGTISGRTAVQKLAYFLSVSNLLPIKFKPHFYGPYSAEITEILDQLVGVHILEETTEKSSSGSSQPIDWKKYQYALTFEGKLYLEQVTLDSSDKTGICNIVQVCDRETRFDISVLSCAAKVHYIITKHSGHEFNSEKKFSIENSYEFIKNMALDLNWKLSDSQINQSFSLLHSLNFL